MTGETLPAIYQYAQDLAEKNKAGGTFTTEAGRIINYQIDPNRLHLVDKEDPYYSLMAFVNEARQGSFHMVTRRTRTSHPALTKNLLNRHPDFYAGQFVSFALDYFAERNLTPTVIRDAWGSDDPINYAQFKEFEQKYGKKARAMRETWSGKMFGSFGYYVTSEKAIEATRHGVVVHFTYNHMRHRVDSTIARARSLLNRATSHKGA